MNRPYWLTPAIEATATNIFEFVAQEGRNASLEEISNIESVSYQAIWQKVKILREHGWIPENPIGMGSLKCLELTKIGREYVLETQYLEEPVNA